MPAAALHSSGVAWSLGKASPVPTGGCGPSCQHLPCYVGGQRWPGGSWQPSLGSPVLSSCCILALPWPVPLVQVLQRLSCCSPAGVGGRRGVREVVTLEEKPGIRGEQRDIANSALYKIEASSRLPPLPPSPPPALGWAWL